MTTTAQYQMKSDKKLRTPDGRVIRNTTGEETVPGDPPEEAARVMQPFVDACLAVVPERPLSTGGSLGPFLFLLGAADRFWQRLGLDDRRFPAFAAELLKSQGGVAASEAVTISAALPQLRDVPTASAVIAEGAAVMDTWLDSHDPDAVLRITELLPQWTSLADELPGKT